MAMTGVERMRAHRVVGAVPRSSRSSIQRQAPGEPINSRARQSFCSADVWFDTHFDVRWVLHSCVCYRAFGHCLLFR
jgi:hypothetical protein